jgi:hypothetical protein
MAKPFVPRFKKKTSPNRNIVKDIKSLANIVTAIPRTLIEEVSIATSKKQKPTPSGVTKKKDTSTKSDSKKDTSTKSDSKKDTSKKDTSTKTKTPERNVNDVRTSSRSKFVKEMQEAAAEKVVTTEQDKINKEIAKLEKLIARPSTSTRQKIALEKKLKRLREKLKNA